MNCIETKNVYQELCVSRLFYKHWFDKQRIKFKDTRTMTILANAFKDNTCTEFAENKTICYKKIIWIIEIPNSQSDVHRNK